MKIDFLSQQKKLLELNKSEFKNEKCTSSISKRIMGVRLRKYVQNESK